MNILFDINHPAHIHLFKNAINILSAKGHNITITSRDKDITIKLLDRLGFKHTPLSKAQKNIFTLGLELIIRQIRLFSILMKNRINVVVSVTGACSVHVCKLLGIPTLVFYDTEHARLQNSLTIPFATKFFTPNSFNKQMGKRHVRYNGFHDLAYLHPNHFKANEDVLNELKLKKDEPFIIIRFVSWEAAHDIGHEGIGLELKREIIKLCQKYAKVFIVSEAELDEEFEPLKFPISPEHMHDALYFAQLYIGEGGSMASEAAILGTPSIFISPLTAGVFDELENEYELMYSYDLENSNVLEKIESILANSNAKNEWQSKRDELFKDKIDLTEYMVNQILSYEQ